MSTVEERVQRVHNLDLEPIVFTLMHPEPSEPGLSLDEADRLVCLYRQYLTLCLRYPDRSLAPSKEIDQAWHAHILDTAKYQTDCDEVFGFFLHHFPYLGLRGETDEQRLHDQYTLTCELFEREFDTRLPNAVYSCAPGTHSSMSGMCVEGADCEHFTRGDGIELRERPRPIRPSQ